MKSGKYLAGGLIKGTGGKAIKAFMRSDIYKTLKGKMTSKINKMYSTPGRETDKKFLSGLPFMLPCADCGSHLLKSELYGEEEDTMEAKSNPKNQKQRMKNNLRILQVDDWCIPEMLRALPDPFFQCQQCGDVLVCNGLSVEAEHRHCSICHTQMRQLMVDSVPQQNAPNMDNPGYSVSGTGGSASENI